MPSPLTTQEQLFMERVATYLVGADVTEAAVLEAAEKVLEDDRRLAAKIFHDDAFRQAAGRHLGHGLWAKVQASKAQA